MSSQSLFLSGISKKLIHFFAVPFSSLIVTLFLFCVSVFADPGSLDPTFNPVGFLNISDFGVRASRIQPDGKIVIGGFSFSPSSFVVIRLNSNGRFDTTLGGTGKVTAAG
jgi:hypothetical protein